MVPIHGDVTQHDARVRAAFTAQARTFHDPDLNRALTSGLEWLVSLARSAAGQRWIDVAGGTGLVGRALAAHAAQVVCVDLTPAMLDSGRAEAARLGISNVEFVVGDAVALPAVDEAFDGVITRFSFHHFQDPFAALAEMARVCRTGGRVVVKDLVAAAEPGVRERQDRLENLRDDSHVRMVAPGEVATWATDIGLQVEAVELRALDRPLEPWLRQSLTPADRAERVRGALHAELAGGTVTGMHPHEQDGELWFGQTWEVTVARKP